MVRHSFIVSMIVIAVALQTGCSKSHATPRPSRYSIAEQTPPVRANLGVCDRREIVAVRSDPPPNGITLVDAENTGGSDRGRPTIALHAKVTIGVTAGRAPQRGDIEQDVSGKLIADRPAWVLVYDHLHIPNPGGKRITGSPSPSQPARYFTAFGYVVDSRTGKSLYGWSCGSAIEQQPTGRGALAPLEL